MDTKMNLNGLAVVLLALLCLARQELVGKVRRASTEVEEAVHTSGLMKGTTPPWLITTFPRSLFSLQTCVSKRPLYSTGQYDSLLIITDGELQVARHDTLLLVITGSISSQFEDLSSEVLQNRRQVHRSPCADALGVLPGLEEPGNAADRELKAGFLRSRDGLRRLGLASAALSGSR